MSRARNASVEQTARSRGRSVGGAKGGREARDFKLFFLSDIFKGSQKNGAIYM